MLIIAVDVNMTECGQLFILALSLVITIGSVVQRLTSVFFFEDGRSSPLLHFFFGSSLPLHSCHPNGTYFILLGLGT